MSAQEPINSAIPLPSPPSLMAAADFETFVQEARRVKIVDGYQLVLDIDNGSITTLAQAQARAATIIAALAAASASAAQVLINDSSLDFQRLA